MEVIIPCWIGVLWLLGLHLILIWSYVVPFKIWIVPILLWVVLLVVVITGQLIITALFGKKPIEIDVISM